MKKGAGYEGNSCNVAGIISQLEGNGVEAHNCINYGLVTAEGFSGSSARVGAITGIIRENNTMENCFYKVGSCDKGIFLCYDNDEESRCTTFEDSDSDFDPLSILGNDFRMKEGDTLPILSWE